MVFLDLENLSSIFYGVGVGVAEPPYVPYRRESFHLLVPVKFVSNSQSLIVPVDPITVIARAMVDSLVVPFGDQTGIVAPVITAPVPVALFPASTTVPSLRNRSVQTFCEILDG
jgi:hypothetical protein